MGQSPDHVQRSQATGAGSVQKKSEGGHSGADAMKSELRGMDYAAGAQALAPVQHLKGAVGGAKTPEQKKKEEQEYKTSGGNGGGGGGG